MSFAFVASILLGALPAFAVPRLAVPPEGVAFYPIVANDLRSGLVASIRHEDGGYLHVYKDY